MGLCEIENGTKDYLYMGNLDSLRDWGHAKDYVEMQWRMLQQDSPKDYVISSGKQTSVRSFIELSAKELGWGGISWEGKGLEEIGRRIDTSEIVIRIDSEFFRPSEVQSLVGDAKKAHKELGWEPNIALEELIAEMIEHDKKIFK